MRSLCPPARTPSSSRWAEPGSRDLTRPIRSSFCSVALSTSVALALATSACGASAPGDHPSAQEVANAINLHSSDLPGWGFVNDGTLDNTSRGGAFSGAGPGGAQSPGDRALVARGISKLATCMKITKSLAYEWMGITQQEDLIARVHTGDFTSPDGSISTSSETGIALSDADARHDSAPYFRPQMVGCLASYLRLIAPAQSHAYAAFGDPVTVTLEDIEPMEVPPAPNGVRATGYSMTFDQVPAGGSSPSFSPARAGVLRIYVGYVTVKRIEAIVFTYAQNQPFPSSSENALVAGIEKRAARYATITFHSTQLVHGVSTGPARTKPLAVPGSHS